MRGEIIGTPLYAKGDVVSGADMNEARNTVQRTLTKYLRSRGHSFDPNLAEYPVSIEIDADGEMQRNVFPFGGMTREFDRLNRDVDGTGKFDAIYAMIMTQPEGIVYQRGREPETQVGRRHGRRGRRGWGGGYGGGWDGGDGYIVEEVVYDPNLIMRTPAIGNEFRSTGRAGNPNASAALIELLPILAPGSRGMSATFSMGPDQILYADICIDGRCYKRSVDVGQVFAAIAQRIAAAHAQLHAAQGQAPSPAAANGAAMHDTVQAAGEVLMGAAFDEHCLTISAGWWHNLVGHRLMCLGRGAAHTLKALKVPIQVAATAAAVAFVGPQAGPVAGQLTGALVDAANGDGNAQQLVDAAQAAAQTNPDVANALGAAQKAVAQTTAGYHVVKTVADAANGDPAAVKQVQDLHTAAASGDAAAQQAVALVQSMASGGGGADAAAPAADGGDATQVSGVFPLLALAAALGGGGYLLWRERQKAQLDKIARGEIARMQAMTAALALPAGKARDAAMMAASVTTTAPPISAGCQDRPMRGEHVIGRQVALVGNAVYHTVGDREQAVKQLALDMTTTFSELATQVGVVPFAGSATRVKQNPVWYAWWVTNAAPMFKAWNAFHQAQVSQLDAPGWVNDWVGYAQKWETDWPVYVQWRARLAALRDGARSIGLHLASAEPSDLPTTLPEDAAELARHLAHKAEHAADDAYDFMKIAAYGVLGLGALVGVAVVVNAGKGKSVKGLYR